MSSLFHLFIRHLLRWRSFSLNPPPGRILWMQASFPSQFPIPSEGPEDTAERECRTFWEMRSHLRGGDRTKIRADVPSRESCETANVLAYRRGETEM